MPDISTLSGDLDSAHWRAPTGAAAVGASGGFVNFSGAVGTLTTTDVLNWVLGGNSWTFKMQTLPTGGVAQVMLRNAGGSQYGTYFSRNSATGDWDCISRYSSVNTVLGSITAAHLASNPYVRMRSTGFTVNIEAGTVYWDTSPDGTTWTNQVFGETADTGTSTGTVSFHDVGFHVTSALTGTWRIQEVNGQPIPLELTKPGSSIVSAGTWLTTTNVFTSNDTYATNPGTTQNTEYPMDVGGFDFSSIPAGSTINGVTVTIEAKTGTASRAQIKGELLNAALINSFEGGTDEVAISTANSGGASGDAFTAVGGTAPVYDTARSHAGSLSARVTGAAGQQSTFRWAITGTSIYTRFYIYVPTGNLPPSTYTIQALLMASGSFDNNTVVKLRSDGKLELSVVLPVVSTNAIALDQWVRIETQYLNGAGPVLRLFNNPESETPTETLTNASRPVGTDHPNLLLGLANAVASSPWWFDDVAVGYADWVGPSITGSLALTALTAADVNYTFSPTATLAQLQSANLKVRVTNKRIVSQASTTSVDYVQILVAYTPPPVAPTARTVSRAIYSATSIGLTWTADTAAVPAPTYLIESSPDGTTGWTTVATGQTNQTGYVVTGLTTGQTYYFRVTGSNSAGSSTSAVIGPTTPTVLSLTNSFEGGSNGTAITAGNSGGASGTAFDAVSGAPTFSSTVSHSGTLAMRTPTNTTHNVQWVGGSLSTGRSPYCRWYVYVPTGSLGTADATILYASAQDIVTATSTGKLKAGTAVSTNSIALDQWIRIEAYIPRNGNPVVRLFNSPESTTPTEEIVHTVTRLTTAIWFAAPSNAAGPWYLDDIAVGDTDWIGPYVPAPALAFAGWGQRM